MSDLETTVTIIITTTVKTIEVIMIATLSLHTGGIAIGVILPNRTGTRN